jgi:hypothetical protein
VASIRALLEEAASADVPHAGAVADRLAELQ